MGAWQVYCNGDVNVSVHVDDDDGCFEFRLCCRNGSPAGCFSSVKF